MRKTTAPPIPDYFAEMSAAERAELRASMVDDIEGLRDGRYAAPNWSTTDDEIAAVEAHLEALDAFEAKGRAA